MKIFGFLLPQTLEIVHSPINGQIKVVRSFGNNSLIVGGLSQSGGLVKNLWETGLKQLNNIKVKQINNILVLGVGGGTVIHLLNKYYKDAKITGIEVDPLMIKLAKKYFALDEKQKVNIIIKDAINWVKIQKSVKFDLILVDMYIGKNTPDALETNSFLRDLKNLLDKDGIIIINRLRNKENKLVINRFIEKLKKNFSSVHILMPLINYLIICYK